LFLSLTLSLTLSCSSKKDDASSGGGSGNIEIVLSSSNITLNNKSLVPMAGTNCNVTTDAGGNESGKCYTPTQVKGIFNMATMGSTMGGAPVRLLGGGTATGLAAVFQKAEFNLKTSPALAGEDNIESGSGTYNLVTLSVQSIEFTIVGTASNKYYHVRVPFTTTPPSANSTFSTCGLGGGLDEADTLGTLYTGITAYPGDILVCIKTSSSESCEHADFQWVDASGNLSSTRPGSPKQLTGSYLYTADSCTAGSSHPEITWGYAGLDIMLSSSVTATAEFTGGTKTYTVGGNSGTALTVTLDIATDNSIFVPSSAISGDLSAATESDILQNITSIQLKPVYIKNRKTNAAPGTGDMTATATLTVE
jgi:hypothetical protein